MKISYNLLKEFVKTNLPAEKLAQTITEHSVEIELLRSSAGTFSGIVTAKILDIQKHPQADRLQIVKLDVGGKTVEPVVCGADNIKVGDVVPLALPGAEIPKGVNTKDNGPFILQKASIRGIKSQGMLCSPFELGLEDQPEKKILILDGNLQSGTQLSKALNNDSLFEIALPANRPDLGSHWGFAREISAILNTKFAEASGRAVKIPAGAKQLKLVIDNKRFCHKHYAIKLSSIKLGPAPAFIQDTLKFLGLKPINNVVDITNYVTQELGQPLHAFDAAKVEGAMIIRNAKKGEKITLLNNNTYELEETMLVIADEKKALDVAGVMGGKDTSVNQDTKEIILVASNFDGVNIRQTSRKLGIQTEASAAFSKGLHPNLVDIGAFRAIDLLKKHAEAKIVDAAIYKTKDPKPVSITFDVNGINKLLGVNFKLQEIKKLLQRFEIKIKGGKKLKAEIPWWRSDLQSMPDIAEELIKLKGYAAIPVSSLTTVPLPASLKTGTSLYRLIKTAKDAWARLGFFEAQNLNFVSEADLQKFGETRPHLEIENPQSSDQRFLKRHLLIPLLKNVAQNHRHTDLVQIFEIGKQYLGFEKEPLLLTAVLSGKTEAPEKLLMKAKGAILEFAKIFGQQGVNFEKTDKPWLTIKYNGETAGLVGLVEEEVVAKFDIDRAVIFVKLELEKIFALKNDIKYREGGKFPAVQRDVSIVVPENTFWQQIYDAVGPLLSSKVGDAAQYSASVELFEAPFLTTEKSSLEYHQALAKQGRKNYGIRLIFEPKNKTLTDQEIASILDKIVLKLKGEIKAEIR